MTAMIIIEKNGKTLYLLKKSAKPVARGKKRKVVNLLGSFMEFLAANP